MSDIALAKGETLIARFQGSRTTYIKEHVMLAALGAVGGTAILMWIGNPHAWTGAIGAGLAIAARGVYVASEQLGFVWSLTDRRLILPDGRDIALGDIETVRSIFSAAQVVTQSGDKYLIKYQPDTAATKAEIEALL